MNKLNQGPRVKIGSRIGSSTRSGRARSLPFAKNQDTHGKSIGLFFLQMRMGESGTSLEAKAKFFVLDEISYT